MRLLVALSMRLLFLLACSLMTLAQDQTGPFAISTFHCLGLYWSPSNGATKEDFVRFRREGDAIWKERLPMRYNPIPESDEDLTDYRGSIVHLTPATAYEIELKLSDGSAKANFFATTWSENFPAGETIVVTNRETPLGIHESGSSNKYRIYDGHGVNDGIGGGSNGSFQGAPGPDSDIYGNIVTHCWDDGQRGAPPIQFGVRAQQR